MKITQLLEATRLKTKQPVVIPWDDEDTSANVPAVASKPAEPPAKQSPQRSLGKTADRETTAQKTANIKLPDSAMSRLGTFMNNHAQDGDDEDAAIDQGAVNDEPVTTRDVPVIISSAMKEAGIVAPEFHKVSNLPGYLVHAIRKMGRAVFAQYTNTPVDDIQLVANLGGQGPNTATEVNSVAKWVHETGNLVTSGEIDFEQSMPGYKADIRVYDVNDIQVMLVKDEYGTYVYSYPADDSKLEHDRNDVVVPRLNR